MAWNALARAYVNEMKEMIDHREGDYYQCLDDAFQGFSPVNHLVRHYFEANKAALVQD